MVLLRFLVLLLAGYPLYWDEQERFVCNTIQPGCANVCYDVFSPVSHFRLWLVQVVILSFPFALFTVYVIHKASMGASMEIFTSSIERSPFQKVHQDIFHKDLSQPGAEMTVPSFLGAYVLQLLLRIFLEVAFGAGHYYLFGFFIPRRYICSEAPCTSTVDCYISRPTEKSIMATFMLGVSCISFLVSIVDLLCVIKRAVRQKHKERLLLEKLCKEEQYYLTPPGRDVDAHLQLAQEHSHVCQAVDAMSVQLGELDQMSIHSAAGPHRTATSNTNGNNAYTQEPEEHVEQDGSEVAFCMTEAEVALPPQTPGRHGRRGRHRASRSSRWEKIQNSQADSSPDLSRPRRMGQYVMVEMMTSDAQSISSERRSEWV
ncbi:gap junction delta-4 protein [Erpetoichthys calabaricus]|uniref:Gap junction protein n=1 Tax=Erpetoichthys calabaricus TaxID=27687 RepID=A0A8C4RYM6_ERPCA|nr:gap junction delta-4 protein [Erpetoichthys calabaricus]